MSLEWQRTRLREIEHLARKLAASAEVGVTSEPVLVRISVRFHPADRQMLEEIPGSREQGANGAMGVTAARAAAAGDDRGDLLSDRIRRA